MKSSILRCRDNPNLTLPPPPQATVKGKSACQAMSVLLVNRREKYGWTSKFTNVSEAMSLLFEEPAPNTHIGQSCLFFFRGRGGGGGGVGVWGGGLH